MQRHLSPKQRQQMHSLHTFRQMMLSKYSKSTDSLHTQQKKQQMTLKQKQQKKQQRKQQRKLPTNIKNKKSAKGADHSLPLFADKGEIIQ